jgi:hypothetical protein
VDQVTRYADKWWNHRNPFYYPCDNDCANFVSQCLIAGGFNLSDGVGYGYNIYGRHSIVRAGDYPNPGLGEYLDEVVGATVIRDSVIGNQIPEAPWDLEPGDVIIFGDPGDLYKHVVIVVDGYGNDAVCNAHSADHWHEAWYHWMDGTFPQSFSIVTFFEIPFSAGGYHNLAYYYPPGWPDPLVVSAEPGNHEQDYNNIEPGQTYYID